MKDIILPDRILKLMSKEDREAYAKSVGQPTAGMTAAEATAAALGKQEKWMQQEFATFCGLKGLQYRWFHMDRKNTGSPGWPDFEIILPTKMCFVELKTPTGRLSEDQERIQAALARCPAVVTIVARSLTEAIEFVKAQEQKPE
jgi:hypothetical protein